MKQYTFILNFGYVEHASLSYMPWTSSNKYKDAKEALVDLANFLKEKFLLKYETKPKKCCLCSKQKDSTAEFCSKCGLSLAKEEFDEEEFESWLYSMGCSDIDTFHGEFIDYDDSERWQSNGMEGSPNHRYVYNAEWVLAAALGYPQRDDQTFEDICKDRTKAKRESFSYYG